MGRKPNQLILEFFERGPKLEDNSNRYQHSCKACGEKFPKGRIDSLTNHLVKKCPAIALRDRQRALLQLHELPDVGSGGGGSENEPRTTSKVETKQLVSRPRQGQTGQQDWTPLETLAEVSRRIEGPGPENGHMGEGNIQADDELSDDYIAKALSNANALPPMVAGDGTNHATTVNGDQPPLDPAIVGHGRLPVRSVKHGMPLEPELAGRGSADASISDKFFHASGPGAGPRAASTWPNGLTPGTPEAFGSDMSDRGEDVPRRAKRNATFPRAMAMHGSHTGYGSDHGPASSKIAKQKVRGRFSASRRKEVQEVRKRGACIRCRMLKKPCSGDSPCSTCRNVESARLWKQPCIRTRIADEFEFYSAGLQQILAHHALNSMRGTVRPPPAPTKLVITRPLSTASVTLAAVDLSLPSSDTHVSGPRIIDSATEDVAEKLELYVRETISTMISTESSDFVRCTLSLASELAYHKEDTFLERAVLLWGLNQLLIEQAWTSSSTSIHQDPTSSSSGSAELDETSRELVALQLLGATERKAGHLSKMVMNELERRLLQRAQSGFFETFLVSLILLNVLERCTWYFQSWDAGSYYGSESESPSGWPLQLPPSYFVTRAETFADMLQMLLKMRGLPPKAQARLGDGVIVPVGGEGSDGLVGRYFESISVSNAFLQDRLAAHFDPTDLRSFDLKYSAKPLIPT